MSDVVDKQLQIQTTDRAGREIDRVLLRIHEVPSLLAYLVNISQANNQVQLDFLALPLDVVSTVKQIIGPIDVKVYTYDVNGRPHTGFSFDPQQLVDLGGETD